MAYTKNSYGLSAYKTNLRYPKRVSKRESKTIQTAIDTVLNDTYSASAAYTLTDEIKTVIASATLAITLPASASNQGRTLKVFGDTSSAATFTADGSDTAPSLTDAGDSVAAGEYVEIICVGTTWEVLQDTTA